MVAIKDMKIPKRCLWDCPLAREDGGACQLVDVRTSDKERPKNCPLVEIEERKVGKWIEVWESQRDEYTGEYDEWREHKCSVCSFQEFDADRFKYCPNCGAEMVGAENE